MGGSNIVRKMVKTKKIILPHGRATLIAKELGVNRSTVAGALNFVTATDLADRIRDIALKNHSGKIISL